MEVIDDSGRVFGVINLLDALVVLVVLMVAAAVAVLLAGGGWADRSDQAESNQTRFGTVTYVVPAGAPDQPIANNGTFRPTDGADIFYVRERYYSRSTNGRIHVAASVAYNGTPKIGSSTVYVGDRPQMTVGSHQVRTTFVGLNRSTPEIDHRESSVIVALNESQTVSHALEPGDTAMIGDQRVARIESVRPRPDGASVAELVGLTLQVRPDGPTAQFGGKPVQVNRQLTVVVDGVVFTGRVYQTGTADTSSLEIE